MRIVLEIENSGKLPLLLEFLRDLKYVKTIDILESELPLSTDQIGLSKKEALEIVRAGSEMTSFGDPVEFQKEQRSDRNLPFEKINK